MLPEPKDDAAAATLMLQDAENTAGLLPGICRVCLGRDVRLHDMWQRGLGAMYSQVVGVQLDTEDKLPRQLCWECVGRLSSANCFIVKALTTQWILTNKITNSGLITISDIESIDRVQDKIASTLGTKFNNVNEYDFLFTEENIEHNNCCNMQTSKLSNNYCNEDISDIKLNGNEEEQIFVTEEFTSEVDSIKSEQVEVEIKEEVHDNYSTASSGAGIDDEEGTTDTYNVNISNMEQAINIIQESASDEELPGNDEGVSEMSQEGRQVVDKSNEVCEVIKQSHKGSNISLSPLSDQKSKMPPGCKELAVLLKDMGFTIYNTEHSSKQLTARADQSMKDIIQTIKNEFRTPIKNKIIFEDDLEMVSEYSDDCVDTVELPQSVVNAPVAPGSTSHHINTKTSMPQETNKIQTKKMNLLTHVNAKHTKSELFNCPFCKYNTSQKWALERHINAMHTKNIAYKCPHCSYKGYRKENFVKHVNVIHNKIFNCPHCSYRTKQEESLLTHMITEHTESEVSKCPHCNFIGYDKVILSRHVNAEHSKRIYYRCPHCSYKTHLKWYLLTHINAVHTKSVVFNCMYCSYKAYRKLNLVRHVNAMHIRNQVFYCPHCSFKTYMKQNLARHLKNNHVQR